MALPYPGMDFTSLDILTAADMDKIVANIEYVNSMADKKFIRLTGNSTSYTANVYMLPGRGDSFIHFFLISTYSSTPQIFQVGWTKDGSIRNCVNLTSSNLTATVTVNSSSEANATANVTVTFSSTCYGGVGIIAVG